MISRNKIKFIYPLIHEEVKIADYPLNIVYFKRTAKIIKARFRPSLIL